MSEPTTPRPQTQTRTITPHRFDLGANQANQNHPHNEDNTPWDPPAPIRTHNGISFLRINTDLFRERSNTFTQPSHGIRR